MISTNKPEQASSFKHIFFYPVAHLRHFYFNSTMMGLKDILRKVGNELNVLTGDKAKNKEYSNEHAYPDITQAQRALEESKRKLFDINGWSNMKGLNSRFVLYDEDGKPAFGDPKAGYYIMIELPGPAVQNWVQITDVRNEPDLAEFIVHPSERPRDLNDPNAEVKHFFAKEASSTFRVSRNENVIHAFEIGRNEFINNKGTESGDRRVLNTLVAEGGWAGFQKIQWDKLTKYLVHSDDVKTD